LVLPGSRARIVRCGGRYDPQLVKRSSEWVSESTLEQSLKPDIGRKSQFLLHLRGSPSEYCHKKSRLYHSLKFAFPSIRHNYVSKYNTKQHISAQYCAKQMSEIWCKNIQAFLRYSNFRAGIFYFASRCSYFGFQLDNTLAYNNILFCSLRLTHRCLM